MTREVRVPVPGGELVAWEVGEGTPLLVHGGPAARDPEAAERARKMDERAMAGEGTDQDAYESLERLEQPGSFTELLAGFLPA